MNNNRTCSSLSSLAQGADFCVSHSQARTPSSRLRRFGKARVTAPLKIKDPVSKQERESEREADLVLGERDFISGGVPATLPKPRLRSPSPRSTRDRLRAAALGTYRTERETRLPHTQRLVPPPTRRAPAAAGRVLAGWRGQPGTRLRCPEQRRGLLERTRRRRRYPRAPGHRRTAETSARCPPSRESADTAGAAPAPPPRARLPAAPGAAGR